MTGIKSESGAGVASSVRLHQAMLAAALVVPALLFLLAAWANYRDLDRESRDVVDRTAAIMQQQALEVFETAVLAVGRANDRINDLGWPAVASPETSAFLKDVNAPLDQVKSIWITSADGTVQAGSKPWPPGDTASPREDAAAAIPAWPDLSISAPFKGALTGNPVFAVACHRTTPAGQPDGTVFAALSPAYFSDIFAQAAPNIPHAAALILASGAVLARDPPVTEPLTLGAGSALMRIMTGGPPAGTYQNSAGATLQYAIRRVGAFPVYVVFAVPQKALLLRWLSNVLAYGGVAAMAALTLLGVSFMALRRAEAEQAALARAEAETRQRHVAEQQLRHAQRLDAVGQLTSGVAHDFNNLLTAILGNLELIDRTAIAGLPEASAARVHHLAATAMNAVGRGATLTRSLLAFSRKQPMQIIAIDVNAVLDAFLELLRQAAGSVLAVTFNPTPGLPPCNADPAELEAALLNLTINARDAASGSGRLTLSTALATLDGAALTGNPDAQPGRFIAIRTADDGAGMTEDVAAKAFEPFFTTKPPGQGTGLGLSQVFGFARQLGGHVALESAPGAGTAVTVFLPVAPTHL